MAMQTTSAKLGDGGQASAPKISLRDVTRRHNTQLALDRITLDIPASTFFVVVGPSGCGKTTLLRMLAGLDAPSEGRIDIADPQPGHPQNAMVFQGDSLFPWMTVWDNAAYGLTMRNVAKARIDDVVGHYLNKTGMYGARA